MELALEVAELGGALGFAAMTVGFAIGTLLGAVVGWAWGGRDFSGDGGEMGCSGAGVGGLVAGLVLATFYVI